MTKNTQDASLLADYLQNPVAHDNDTRERLIVACQEVVASLETPIETARKLAFLTLDHAVVRCAIQLNLFSILSQEERSYSSQELAVATTPPSNDVLLSRLLRYLASPLRLIEEKGNGFWKGTARGSLFTQDGFKAGCSMYFDSGGPAFQAFPRWICTQGDEKAQSAFQLALPNEDSFFKWLEKDEHKLQSFHCWMETLSTYQFCAQDIINIQSWIPGTSSDNDVVFVDVGGGTGGQSVILASRRATFPGRIVNEDVSHIPPEAEAVLRSHNIDHITYNFFDEQPIKGACIYHFRQIFHDWPDEECAKILSRAKEAMTASSTLLIDEVVIPEKGAHWMVMQRDLTMMALFNAAERSEMQWRALLQQAGLRIEEIQCYDERMAACMIVAKLI
ncbi:sterigmatocystin 8-o-methyltransferase [Fusarium sporotrichioides]|uniref:Sterigmatocystin 8-o-methyltransferase n=1 Tax=Fusarium sporotrichioides TaxID=5514 RepID=A0A395S8I4_FUSSP|nr:sterigmatocystin 8-o-methyltransferase [Fusarium sporotrichioides]